MGVDTSSRRPWDTLAWRVWEAAAEAGVPARGSDLFLGIARQFPEHVLRGFVREGLLCGAGALHARESSISRANFLADNLQSEE
jgi:hypothetical protein